MTSILTNLAAISALRILRATGVELADARGQMSSGLRIRQASDDAAYWSIATTMRSDKGALSAVSDALGLGAATVDTAYEGVSAVVGVLDEVKMKLVAAMEPGVDKAKIQEEISQLSEQAKSIARSASFNGVNWLDTNVPRNLLELNRFSASIVSSFTRSPSGQAAAHAVDVDLRRIALVNTAGGGLLQKEGMDLRTIGGFRGTDFATSTERGHQVHAFTGPATFSGSDVLTFDITVDFDANSAGSTYSVTINKGVIDAALGTSDGVIGSGTDMRKVLQVAFGASGVPATTNSYLAGSDPSSFEIASLETSGGAGSSIWISNINTSQFSGGTALGLENTPTLDVDNMYAQSSFTFDHPFKMFGDAEFYFDLQVGTAPKKTVTVTKAMVDAALGRADGNVNTAADLAAVLSHVGQSEGLKATATGTTIMLTADRTLYPNAGARATQVTIGNVSDNIGWLMTFDLDEIDITKSDYDLDEYLTGLEYMQERVTSAATMLGATQKRIDMQSAYASSLMNTIDRGVGRLVDADMNEISTRMKALEVRQQLTIQSLQIANSNAQNVLMLFR